MEWLTGEMLVGIVSAIILIGSNLGWWKRDSIKTGKITAWMEVATKAIAASDKDSEGGSSWSENERKEIIRELNEALGKVK